MKKKSLIYVNKEIESADEDFIGFSAQVDSIADAIDNGASMVGIIADYGSGKSSVGELLEAKKQFKKPIRVNMWDSLKNVKQNQLDEDALISLDKSFLYQVAYNSRKKGLARHVNKRLNKSNGFISFTLKSWKFWCYFVIAALLVTTGIFLQASDFSFQIEKYTINNQFFWGFYLLAGIVIIVGLRKGSIAFSSWKSEGDKKFDSSDVFSIYSEIVDSIKPWKFNIWKKKRIIIIEDLDRLGKNDIDLITNFIKEVYRFSNLSKNYDISFIVSIKPAAQLYTQRAEKDFSLDYDKVFDYIVDLRPIHIDDFNAILKSLLDEKKEQLKEILPVKNDEDIYAQFSILIGGEKLNIRKLKHRLNAALLLFQSLRKKQVGEEYNINMRTCCVVAYLQSQYEESYNNLISADASFNNIVKRAYSLMLSKEKTTEDQIKTLKDYIFKLGINKESGIFEFDENFCDELSSFLIHGLINKDFRQYFYSYPKESYIKTIEESELEEYILFPNKDISSEYFDIIVEEAILCGGRVIDDSVQMLKDRNITLPTLILNNGKLLEYCYKKFPQDVVTTMQKNLLWDNENGKRTVEVFKNIDKYNISSKLNIYMDYSAAMATSVGALGAKATNCRLGLVKALGHNIVCFLSIFHVAGSPILTNDEVNSIESEDDLFELIDEEKFSAQLIIALSEKFKSPISESNYNKLNKIALNCIKTVTANSNLAESILNILLINGKCNNTLFEYVVDNVAAIEKIVCYVNSISSHITPEYCRKIEDEEIVGEFNAEALEAFYKNECTIAYLTNIIHNDRISSRDYDVNIFDEDTVVRLYKFDEDMFFEYRLNLLKQNSEVKQSHEFMYSREFPFISEEEIEIMTCADCLALIQLDTVEANLKSYKTLVKSVIKSDEDLKAVAVNILEYADGWALDVFRELPFEQFEYRELIEADKAEVLNLYEEIEAIETNSAIIDYMELTGDLLETLEIRLKDIIESDGIEEDDWSKYINLLNKLNRFTDTTIEILRDYSDEDKLPPAITDRLLELGEVKIYIVGKTLYNKNFEFEKGVLLEDYLEIYSKRPEVAQYMIQNNDFLVSVYQGKKFDSLNKEQLFIYNGWDQIIELIRVVLKKCTSVEERKNYIMNAKKLATLNDSDAFQRLICSGQYDDLLNDEKLIEHIKYLLWDEHPGLKGAFTRYVNRINKKAS